MQTVNVPWDFVAVGGGVIGQALPNGALIVRSEAAGAPDWRGWIGRTSDNIVIEPHLNTVFVIGMRISNLSVRDLRLAMRRVEPAWSTLVERKPSNHVPLPSGFVLLSGGVYAVAHYSNAPSLLGQYVTQSAPGLATAYLDCELIPRNNTSFRCTEVYAGDSWNVASTDHMTVHPGTDNVSIIALPATLIVNGRNYAVATRVVRATSAPANHPAVDVRGLLGEYALTGIGASVELSPANILPTNPRPLPIPKPLPRPSVRKQAGNLLWKLEPRPDIGGASVASKDHVSASPAKITAYAIGVKLIPQ